MTTIADIQAKLLNKLESKLPGGNITPAALKKVLNHFDIDRDGVISLAEFLRAANGKIEADEAEFLFMFWDSAAGEREPCGMVEVDVAVNDLLSSMPQYSTLLKGADPVAVANRGKGNRPSQEGGIFGGGMYAAESERESASANRNRAAYAAGAPVKVMEAPAVFSKPVNNASSIPGGIFGGENVPPPAPGGRSNRSNQSSVEGGIFGSGPAEVRPPSARGRDTNQSSIPGGIFG